MPRHFFALALRSAVPFGVFALLLPAASAQPDWTQRPAVGPPPAFTPPPVERFTLSNGLPVLFMEKPGVPLAQVNLLVRAGSAADPTGKFGLASMMADMLDEGAGPRDALALADALDFLGVSLSTGAGHHHYEVQLHAPLARLDSALGIMADVALRPTFPANELDRLRAQLLTAFTQRRDQPRALASLLFNRVLYGEAHPYGRPVAGDPAGVRALTRDDLARFHSAYTHPDNAALVVVGALSRADAQARLERHFGAAPWPAARTTAERPRVADAPQVARRTVYLVDKPGAAQSVIYIGRIGVPRSTPEYAALEVLNTVLGGSFTSRLNQNLRERNGYSYGAGSSFSYREGAGPFVARSDVQTDATGPALREFFHELAAIEQPIPDEELAKARSYAALSFPQAFQTVAGAAGVLSELWLYDLPEEAYREHAARLLAVTSADASAAAGRTLDDERVAVVVVGDRAQVEAAVRALDLGPVEVLTIDDVAGPPDP